jgi:hypothetical protein
LPHEIRTGLKRTPNVMRQLALDGLREQLETFVPRVPQVLRQARNADPARRYALKGKLPLLRPKLILSDDRGRARESVDARAFDDVVVITP